MSTTRVGIMSLIVKGNAGFIGMLLVLGLLIAFVAGFATMDLKDRLTIQAVVIIMIVCLVLLVLGLVVWFKYRYVGLSIMVMVSATVLGTLLLAVFVNISNLRPDSHAGSIEVIQVFITICVVLLVLGVFGWFKLVRHMFLDDSRIRESAEV